MIERLDTHSVLEFLDRNSFSSFRKLANRLYEPSTRFSTPFRFVVTVLEAGELIESNLHGSSSQVSNEWLDFINISSLGRNDWKNQRVLLPHSELYDDIIL
jgi:hypothetical protein